MLSEPDRPALALAPPPSAPAVGSTGLRPYQQEALAAVVGRLSLEESALVVMATGTGKTRTVAALIDLWHTRTGKPCLILAQRGDLLYQAQRTLAEGYAVIRATLARVIVALLMAWADALSAVYRVTLDAAWRVATWGRLSCVIDWSELVAAREVVRATLA